MCTGAALDQQSDNVQVAAGGTIIYNDAQGVQGSARAVPLAQRAPLLHSTRAALAQRQMCSAMAVWKLTVCAKQPHRRLPGKVSQHWIPRKFYLT